MEALDPVVSEGKLRKYDLKVSTSDRKVLSHFDSYDLTAPISDVLKDNDFDFLENYIELKPQARDNLINTLVADTSFFRMNRIIDYSLILNVVDLSKLPENFIVEELRSRNHHIFKCAETPNLVYYVGIIDYF